MLNSWNIFRPYEDSLHLAFGIWHLASGFAQVRHFQVLWAKTPEEFKMNAWAHNTLSTLARRRDWEAMP
jgi:hypothetical protein